MTEQLFDKVRSSIPLAFWKTLLRRQSALYEQALDYAFASGTWERPEAYQVFQAARRANMESAARAAARTCKLKAFDMNHAGNNCGYVMVKADQLILTFHYVDTPGEFVREAESRKQHAGVNGWIYEYVNEGMLLEAPPSIDDGKPIYINILHGASLPTARQAEKMALNALKEVDVSTCFMRVAIPDVDSAKYVTTWSVQDFIEAAIIAQPESISEGIDDKAKPVLNPKKRKAKGTASGGTA